MLLLGITFKVDCMDIVWVTIASCISWTASLSIRVIHRKLAMNKYHFYWTDNSLFAKMILGIYNKVFKLKNFAGVAQLHQDWSCVGVLQQWKNDKNVTDNNYNSMYNAWQYQDTVQPGLAEIPAPVGSQDVMSQMSDYPLRQ